MPPGAVRTAAVLALGGLWLCTCLAQPPDKILPLFHFANTFSPVACRAAKVDSASATRNVPIDSAGLPSASRWTASAAWPPAPGRCPSAWTTAGRRAPAAPPRCWTPWRQSRWTAGSAARCVPWWCAGGRGGMKVGVVGVLEWVCWVRVRVVGVEVTCLPAVHPPSQKQAKGPQQSRLCKHGTRCRTLCNPHMQVASGDLFECAPVERVTAGPDPEPCALPYVYRGRNRTDCVWVGGVEACKVGAAEPADEWQRCWGGVQELWCS